MTVARETEVTILHLCNTEGLGPSEAATLVGVHRDVVDRVLEQAESGRPEPAPRPSMLDPFKPMIEDKLAEHPKLHATRIWQMAQERGFTGSSRIVQRFVSTVRPVPSKKAYVVREHLPAEEGQVDWGHVGQLRVDGGWRALWVFVMWLAFSRYRYAELVFDLTAESLRRSMIRAVTFFKGTTRRWVFDNPKTIVLERHGRTARLHPMLLDLAASFNVQPTLARVRTPTDKGGVERAIRDLKEGFFAGRTIMGLDSGNAALRTYLETIVARRPHPVFRERTVAEVFQDEQPRLLSLPAAMPSCALVTPVAVDATASIRLGTNRYSVPPEHVGRSLTLAADDDVVRVLDGEREVARHPRSWGKNQRIDDPRHREALTHHRPIARDITVRARLVRALPELGVLYERWVENGRNLNFMTARVSKLFGLYGQDILSRAVTAMVARGTHDPGALALLCEQERMKGTRPVPIALELGEHVPDEVVVPHDLASYDADRAVDGKESAS
jgi:transposase